MKGWLQCSWYYNHSSASLRSPSQTHFSWCSIINDGLIALRSIKTLHLGRVGSMIGWHTIIHPDQERCAEDTSINDCMINDWLIAAVVVAVAGCVGGLLYIIYSSSSNSYWILHITTSNNPPNSSSNNKNNNTVWSTSWWRRMLLLLVAMVVLEASRPKGGELMMNDSSNDSSNDDGWLLDDTVPTIIDGTACREVYSKSPHVRKFMVAWSFTTVFSEAFLGEPPGRSCDYIVDFTGSTLSVFFARPLAEAPFILLC